MQQQANPDEIDAANQALSTFAALTVDHLTESDPVTNLSELVLRDEVLVIDEDNITVTELDDGTTILTDLNPQPTSNPDFDLRDEVLEIDEDNVTVTELDDGTTILTDLNPDVIGVGALGSDAPASPALADIGAVGIFLNADMPDDLVVTDVLLAPNDVLFGTIEESADTLLALNEIGDDALDISLMLETTDNITEAIQDFVHNTDDAEAGIVTETAVEPQQGGLAGAGDLDDLPQAGSDQIII